MTNRIAGRSGRSWQRMMRRALAIVLAALLAWGQVPSAAWAAEAASAPGQEAVDTSQPAADGSSALSSSADGADGQGGSQGSELVASDQGEAKTGETAAASDSGAADDAGSSRGAAPSENAGKQDVSTLAEESLSVTVRVIGRDPEGEIEDWAQRASFEVPAGSTAADVSERLFAQSGLTADYGDGSWGWSLNTITDPHDSSRTLGYDAGTRRYWQLFVNGSAASVGAGSVVLEPGDSVVWFYSSYGEGLPGAGSSDDVKNIVASLQVIGIDGAGEPQTWLPLVQTVLPEGSTAADLTEMLFKQYGIASDIYTVDTHGYWMLNTVTSPTDPSLTLGYNASTGAYWALFVNGKYAEIGADATVIQPGDAITWCYTASTVLPEGDVALNPDAEHPDLGSSWPGFAGGGAGAVVEGVDTPAGSGAAVWKHSLLTDDERANYASPAASDPIIVGGKIYLVIGSSTYDAANNWAETKSLGRLEVIDASTGAVERTVALSRGLDSTCRPVYADGIIVIPLAGGFLQAVSASTLETIWTVDAIEGAQCISTLTASDGYVYVATADSLGSSGGMYGAESGTLRRVNLYTGALSGVMTSDSAGYYWAGGISTKGYFVIGDDAGEVVVYTSDLSQRLSATKLSAYVHASLMQSDGYIYAVTADGVLHKLTLSDAGAISEVGSCRFASSSTSTPTIVDGVAYVGGSSDGAGALAVIDLGSMTVKALVDDYGDGSADGVALPSDVKSAPLVSVRGDDTYVYFTSNGLPGGIYSYRVGDERANLLFEPSEGDQNYSISSVVCGPDGTLYFTNDSGNLFAVRSKASSGPSDDEKVPDTNNGAGDKNPAGNNGGETGGGLNAADKGSSSHIPGTVSPAARPIAASDATDDAADTEDGQDTAAAEEEQATEGEDSAAARMSAAPTEADAARGGIPRWLPITGIIVGACGLVVIGVYLTLLHKRS